MSNLISDRWSTGVGEIGVLLSGAYQRTNFRTDINAVEPFNLRRDLVDLNGNGATGDEADAIFAPGGGGIDLTDPANFTFDRIARFAAANTGSELAVQTDAEFEIDSDFLKAVKVGVCYADRKATNGSVYVFTGLTPIFFVVLPGRDRHGQYRPVQQGRVRECPVARPVPRPAARPDPRLRPDPRRVRGLPLGTPATAPLTQFDLSERTSAFYIMGDYAFEVGTVRVSGNAGVRVIETDTSTIGDQVTPGGGFAPVSVGGRYVSALPNFNLRADLTDKLTLRAAASRGLTGRASTICRHRCSSTSCPDRLTASASRRTTPMSSARPRGRSSGRACRSRGSRSTATT